jgi:arginine decarboxylase
MAMPQTRSNSKLKTQNSKLKTQNSELKTTKEAHVQLKTQTYASYLKDRHAIANEGPITDFLTRRGGELYFGNRVNLNALVRRYGAPLEVVYCPQITTQVQRMQSWAEQARSSAGYTGGFLYAYATKANFAAEAVQTALDAGAHYETSAAADVLVAHSLWQRGVLPSDRMIFCNGSKEPNYRQAIRQLRNDGCRTIVAVLDDLDELEDLLSNPKALLFGVRERAAGNRDGTHPGNDRFGLTSEEIRTAARRIAGTRHQLAVYHAMIGSQVEDREHFIAMLRASVKNYCELRREVSSLKYFNFGGGVPTAGYRLDFAFDYERFLYDLMETIKAVCAEYGVPMPDLIGEFGRYTVATHSLLLLEIGATKAGAEGNPDWYLVNGSMMVSMPDSVFVEGQEFVVLPLTNWDAEAREVRLAGRRTCDSDDVYPRPHQPPLVLPDTGAGSVIAICGLGAYQQMISGRGGAHHCLSPEPQRVIISDVAGTLVTKYVPQQDQASIMRLLGYQPQRITASEPLRPAAAPRPIKPFPTAAQQGRRRSREKLRVARAR